MHVDRPAVVKMVRHVRGLDVVGGVEAGRPMAVVSVERVVDEQERATGCNRGEDRPDRVVVGSVAKRRVHDRDEIERPGRQLLARHVGADPVDLNAGRACSLAGAIERDCGDVDGGDGPTLLSQPDGVGTFAAADVERGADLQRFGLRDERGVRFTTPERVPTIGVATVPIVGSVAVVGLGAPAGAPGVAGEVRERLVVGVPVCDRLDLAVLGGQ